MGSAILLCIAPAFYVFCTFVYRLFWSPIRHFPGPRLAALTFWYEGYYDVFRDGRYTWKIKQLHEKYGPAVRINPCELHVSDPEFFHTLYVGPTRRTHKWYWSARMFGTNNAIVSTVDHQLHHSRKNALLPFFSKASVSQLEPLIQAKVERLSQRLNARAGRRGAVNMSDIFSAFSGDVIGSYVFGVEYGFLEHPDFAPEWRSAMTELSRSTHLMKQLGWANPVIKRIADGRLGATVARLYKPLRCLFDIRKDTERAIDEARSRANASPIADKSRDSLTKKELRPVIESLLASPSQQLPESELTTDRLTDECLTLLGAGSVTTAQTLTTALYFILASPSTQSSLRAELDELHAECEKPTWSQLARLPYLTAVLHEALRLSYGVASRLPRISPDTDLILPDGRTIPRGTPVSMTQMFLHDDPNIFAIPPSFIPERWMPSSNQSGNDVHGNTTVNNARKYFVPFSRGTRACLGTNLAWAELYMCIAGLFRPVECGGVVLDLFDTTEREVRVEHDYFNPAPAKGSVGVRVIVK